MSEYVLIDCNRIQEYVFASSRLREICKASLLLDWIETKKIPEIAENYGAEVIRSGGGVNLIKTNNGNAETLHNEIITIFKKYGIEVTSINKSISNSGSFYKDILSPLFKEICGKKDRPEKKIVLPSTIIAVPCEASGSSPAEYVISTPHGEKKYCFSSAAKSYFKKRESEVEVWLKKEFKCFDIPDDLGGIVSWSKRGGDFEKEPGTSERRLLGVIYADVNGLGSLTEKIAKDESTYSKFSNGLRDAIKCSVFDALFMVIGKAINNRRQFPSNKALPVRVLYIGGDDLALAVQGCFALDVTSEILRSFEKHSQELLKKTGLQNDIQGLTMSAGVVIAPHKYPFFSFNRLGKELEQRAKSAGRLNRLNNIPKSYIDFCLVKNNAIGGLNEILAKVDLRLLSGGPYTLDEVSSLEKAVENLLEKEFPMNKLKKLVSILSSPSRRRLYKIWWERLEEDQQKVFEKEAINRFNLEGEDVPLWRNNPLGLNSTPVVDIIDLITLIKVRRRGGE